MICILGAGGHARVLAGILDLLHLPYRMSKSDDDRPEEVLVIGIGDIAKRRDIYNRRPAVFNLVHPSAVVAAGTIGKWSGAQVMAGAVINPGASIGSNVIINTRASIDHDCNIGHHCHIAPGAILCGNVTVGDESFIGAGAIVVQGVSLDPGSFIPAGSLVVGPHDIRRPLRAFQYDGADKAQNAA